MKSFLTLLLIALVITSCHSKSDSVNPDPKENVEVFETNFIHTVYFWLKEGITVQEKATFAAGLLDLATAPSIDKYFIGTPANTARDVIDSSYDYAWIVHFANAEDQAIYQSDSIHLDFIEKYNSLWVKVIVYDSVIKAKSE